MSTRQLLLFTIGLAAGTATYPLSHTVSVVVVAALLAAGAVFHLTHREPVPVDDPEPSRPLARPRH